jgi:hypothetical protein
MVTGKMNFYAYRPNAVYGMKDCSSLKHAMTQFLVFCKYLAREKSRVRILFPWRLSTIYDTLSRTHFELTSKCARVIKYHQAPHGPDLAIITPRFGTNPLENPLLTISTSFQGLSTHTNICG